MFRILPTTSSRSNQQKALQSFVEPCRPASTASITSYPEIQLQLPISADESRKKARECRRDSQSLSPSSILRAPMHDRIDAGFAHGNVDAKNLSPYPLIENDKMASKVFAMAMSLQLLGPRCENGYKIRASSWKYCIKCLAQQRLPREQKPEPYKSRNKGPSSL
jgi:hypothetical protein